MLRATSRALSSAPWPYAAVSGPPPSKHLDEYSLARRKMASGMFSNVCAVLGSQWGDEGKGKLADVLAQQ